MPAPEGQRKETRAADMMGSRRMFRWLGFGLLGLIAVILLSRFLGKPNTEGRTQRDASTLPGAGDDQVAKHVDDLSPSRGFRSLGVGEAKLTNPTTEVQVKVAAYGRSRHRLVLDLAGEYNIAIPQEVSRFFESIERSDWDGIKELYGALSSQRGEVGVTNDLRRLWPPIREAYAAIELSAMWKSADLAAYGRSVARFVEPGAIFVGSPGLVGAVPVFLGQSTSEGGQVLVDSGVLGDPDYVEYLRYLHGGRLAFPPTPTGGTPTGAASQVEALRAQNPSARFVLEPGALPPSMAESAIPLGPLLEVPAQPLDAVQVAARASESISFWRELIRDWPANELGEGEEPSRRAMASMATSQAETLLAHGLVEEATQVHRMACELAPGTVEPVRELARHLHRAGKTGEAREVVDAFLQHNEDKRWAADDFARLLAEPTDRQP